MRAIAAPHSPHTLHDTVGLKSGDILRAEQQDALLQLYFHVSYV